MADEDHWDKSRADEDHWDKSKIDEGLRYIFVCASSIMAVMFMCFFVFKAMQSHIDIQHLHIREDSIVMDLEYEFPLNSDDLNITLYCASCQSFSAIGHCIVPGFNAGPTTEHREAVVVPCGPSWDDMRWKLAQGLTVELRVEITTLYIESEKCRHCSSFREREKCHCSDCREPTPVKVVANFLLDGSVKVTRIS